jgi:hypothetical protein
MTRKPKQKEEMKKKPIRLTYFEKKIIEIFRKDGMVGVEYLFNLIRQNSRYNQK